MVKPSILSEKPITITTLKSNLTKIKERDGELNFRANKTEEYLNEFVTLDDNKAAELADKLEKLKLPRIKEEHIIKIVDMLPETVNDLKAILQGYTITVNNENAKKIVETVKEYLPEK